MHTYNLKPSIDGQVYVLNEANQTAAICPDQATARRVARGLALTESYEAHAEASKAAREQRQRRAS